MLLTQSGIWIYVVEQGITYMTKNFDYTPKIWIQDQKNVYKYSTFLKLGMLTY